MREDPSAINMSGISVSGVGGLGLLAIVALIAWTMPQAWWLETFGAIGGTVLGAAIVTFRRFRAPSGPSGEDPRILFRAHTTDTRPASPAGHGADLTLSAVPLR
jgi:hypothetical protein